MIVGHCQSSIAEIRIPSELIHSRYLTEWKLLVVLHNIQWAWTRLPENFLTQGMSYTQVEQLCRNNPAKSSVFQSSSAQLPFTQVPMYKLKPECILFIYIDSINIMIWEFAAYRQNAVWCTLCVLYILYTAASEAAHSNPSQSVHHSKHL